MGGHRIRTNKSCQLPGAIICVDTESYPLGADEYDEHQRHRLRLGHARYCRLERGRPSRTQWLDFNDPDKFWTWALMRLSKGRTTWLFAHNLPFDFTLLDGWQLLESEDAHLDFACLEDPPTILRISTPFGRLFCLDTLNWYRCSLAELGESVGVPKLPMPSFSADDAAWREYCIQDVTILERVVLRLIVWIYEHDLGCVRATAPAQAMQAWRHKWSSSLPYIHDCAPARALEREAYYGGQCECYFQGIVLDHESAGLDQTVAWDSGPAPTVKGPVHVLDTTSLLPYVMKSEKYPCALLGYRDEGDLNHMRRLCNLCGVVARVHIKTDERAYPLRRGHHVEHVVGDYWTTMCGPDLQLALEWLDVSACGPYSWYELSDLFSGYVDYFWDRRMEARKIDDRASEQLAKLMLNSLYGKLGQRSHVWQDDHDAPCLRPWGRYVGVDADSKVVTEYRGIAGRSQRKCVDADNPESFPAISAFVTAYGRQRMRRFRAVCPPRSIYYQGEDSLHVSDAGLDALRRSDLVSWNEMGYLRLVETVSCAEYRGRYNYTLDGEHKIAGIRRCAQRLPDGTWEQIEFERAGSIVARRPDGTVGVSKVRIRQPVDTRIGVVGADGWVTPYRITPESERALGDVS